MDNAAPDLSRLLRPRSIAVLGGSWARNVIEQCRRMHYDGDIWPVHPQRSEVAGLPCFASVQDLPAAPDATFIGVNRFLTIDVVTQLSAMGAGGVVCFASGFGEAANEDRDAERLQRQLLAAAGRMPLIGPNCYGLINYLDGALLWPDQHGGERVDSGVAIITQSSNIAINLTMQRRALPISYVLTAGNQAQLSLGQLATALLADERVTALGLYIEGFGDIAAFEQMAATAKSLGKAVVALKTGRTDQARQAMISHTNSLSGSDSAAEAFLARLGIARVDSLPVLLETLKLLHCVGALPGNAIQSMSCSGGEASLMADAARGRAVHYPPLSAGQYKALSGALGPLVALANPLDYHTFIWGDVPAMTATFSAMLSAPADLSFLVLDFPRGDRCEHSGWYEAIEALIAARDANGATVAVLASLPENMPDTVAAELLAAGVVPLCGIDEAMRAVEAAHFIAASFSQAPAAPCLQLAAAELNATDTVVLDEASAKDRLRACTLSLPESITVDDIEALPAAAERLGYPLVLKGRGLAHKTEASAVALNLRSSEQLTHAARSMQQRVSGFLLEQYIEEPVAELLLSIVRDPTHGFQLTIASGGVLTELLGDASHLLLPVERAGISAALSQLKVATLLSGYRAQAAASLDAIVDAVLSLQDFALEHADTLLEVEINPLLCSAKGAYVADALIRFIGEPQ